MYIKKNVFVKINYISSLIKSKMNIYKTEHASFIKKIDFNCIY